MNADVRISDSRFDPQLWTQRWAGADLCINCVMLRRSGAGDRERNRVLCRIARVQTSSAVGRTRRCPVVVMNGKPMVVLRMIVIRIGVGVQGKRHARRRDQRGNEQQRQDAVHSDECMRRGHSGQNDNEGCDLGGSLRIRSLLSPRSFFAADSLRGCPTHRRVLEGTNPAC